MTTDQRLVLDVTDVLALRLECTKCGAAVSIRPLEWNDQPWQCPGCGTTWALRQLVPTPLQHLGTGMKLLLEEINANKPPLLPYRVRFEVDRPRS